MRVLFIVIVCWLLMATCSARIVGRAKTQKVEVCRTAAEFAVLQLNKNSKTQMNVSKMAIEKCETQIVAGMNFIATIGFEGGKDKFVIRVYRNLQNELQVTNVKKVAAVTVQPIERLLGGFNIADPSVCKEAAKAAVNEWNDEHFSKFINTYAIEGCGIQVVAGIKYKIVIKPVGRTSIEFEVVEDAESQEMEVTLMRKVQQ